MRILYVLLIGILLFTSCKSKSSRAKAVSSNTTEINVPNSHNVKVKEVVQTSQYTYLFVNENNEDYWIAVEKMEVKAGDGLQFNDYLEMKNFKSRELDKVFDRVLFVQNINDESSKSPHASNTMNTAMMMKPKAKKEAIKVEKAPNGITIAELYKTRKDYQNKKVNIRGQVVKVNRNIMKLNWIHIQDGTKDGNNFDLTITTNGDANVGDVITIEGKVILNKDFGAGYSYELIVQEAIIK